MSNHHIVYVPIAWSTLSIKALRVIIELEILRNFRRKNKIEGTVICLAGTVAVLERREEDIWMKRCNDVKTDPYHDDYISVFISCIFPGP
ncbi:hypothetical protein GFV_13g0050 [Bracoviriform facetosae]|uniref:Uncharacterized protein n=1 Tax=Bracoviriform facetosae TaxID=2083300 RepID=B8PQ65_9VIRU|nr:hypothetical protein GFV_13g0050 [Bracoviriform facetosae]ACE75491.1 hypothetical protein GFV_13g0050 [Bracoviriform facetosae]